MKCFRYLIVFAIWLYMVAFFQTRVNMTVVSLYLNNDIPGSNNQKSSFQWTQWAKSKLVSSYFYGYAAGQFVGGLISFYFGPKRTIAVCLILSAVLVIICPFIEQYGVIPLSICRALLGIFGSPLFASKNVLVGTWAPTRERSFINSIVHSGLLFGVAFSNIVGGLMSSSSLFAAGWKQFLFVSGGFNALAALVWVIVVKDSPHNHPWVNVAEKEYIKINTFQKAPPEVKVSVPYKAIFMSPQVWIQTLAFFGHLSILFTMLVNLSVFLQDVFKVSSDKASYYAIIPFCGNFVVIVGYPLLIDYLRAKRGFNVTKLRRFSTGLAFTGSCIILACLGFLPNHTPVYAILLVTIAMCFHACNYTGFTCAAIELAPQYSGIIVGINSTFASTSGFIITLIKGKLIDLYKPILGWRYTFIIIAMSSFVFAIPFMAFGSSELQDWAKPPAATEIDIDLE